MNLLYNMTNIASIMPTESKTVEAIYACYKRSGDSEAPRGYLGASIIGHSCERYLWYTFRFCCKPEFSGRMYRLFETGDLEEDRFANDLRSIGCTVHVTGENEKQFEVSELSGHFSGHLDGCALGVPEAPKTWHVLEFKTHCNKSFTKLHKEGVKAAKPMHYTQMQAYMHLTGMTRALYMAVNKDTDELYAERVRYDKEFAEKLLEKAKRIIFSTECPARITDRPDYWECSYCDAKELCWGTSSRAVPLPERNCRQCCHATPTLDGNACWKCEKHSRRLSAEDQVKSCEDHLLLPGLITFAEPINSNENWIEFTTKDGRKFWHGNGPNLFSTNELRTISASSIFSPMLNDAKQLFNAAVQTYSEDDILSRYPECDSRMVWTGNIAGLIEAWKMLYQENILNLKPLNQVSSTNYFASEYERGRVVIAFDKAHCEIREGKE